MLHLRQRADAKTRCVTVDGMPRVITEIKDLKAEIDAVSQIAASGDAGWATQLGCFSFAPNVDHLQAMDPRSQAYFEEQYLLYEQIRGGVYESSNELHGSEPFPGIYPYFTRNLQEIGTHLIRIANVVGSLPLNAGDYGSNSALAGAILVRDPCKVWLKCDNTRHRAPIQKDHR